MAFAIPILHYILKLHPQLQSPLTPASSKSKQSADRKEREKLKPQKRKHGDSKEPLSSDKKRAKTLEWESGGVIDLNQVIHSTQEDPSELHSGLDPLAGESDQEQLAVVSSEPDNVADNDFIESESQAESEGEEVSFIVDSDGEGTLSDDDGGCQLLSGEGGLFVEGSEVEEVPKKKRKRASVYRMMRERVRAKRRCGARDRRRCEAVRVRDNIPEEEFQLMLEGEAHTHTHTHTHTCTCTHTHTHTCTRTGKLDVSSSLSPNTQYVSSKLNPSQSAEQSLPPTETGSGCGLVAESGCGLIALILTPTRELALQVHSHIKAVAKHTGVRVGHTCTHTHTPHMDPNWQLLTSLLHDINWGPLDQD